MAVFGGMTLTNKGLVLQGKAQAGAQLNYTRIAVGDGSLTGQSIPALNGLISQKKSLSITRLKTQPPNKATIGTVLRNTDVTTGFYWREVGLFAQDPDAGEILYAYANAGVTADYIPPGGGSDVIEKQFDVVVVVGTAANISAVIDDSLVYAKKSELDAIDAGKVDKVSGKGLSTNDYTNPEKTKLAGIAEGANNYTHPATHPASMITEDGSHRFTTDAEKAAWNGKETPSGAQAKADGAQAAAISAAATDASNKAAGAQAAAIAAAAQDAMTKADAAREAAKTASIPLSQKGALNGVATLNANGDVMAKGAQFDNYFTKTLGQVTLADGKRVGIVISGGFCGSLDVTVSGVWNNSPAEGMVKKRFDLNLDAVGTKNLVESYYVDVTGRTRDSVAIGGVNWDAGSSHWVITVESLPGSALNNYVILVDGVSMFGLPAFTLSTVYNAAASTLPYPVQQIPDDTKTVSGYLIQKHRLTTNHGTVINLPSGYDLNNLQVNGFFDGSGLINTPNNSTNWFYIESIVHSNSPDGYRYQKATMLVASASQPVSFDRVMQGYTWGPWQEIITTRHRGMVNGVAGLDGLGKVPRSQSYNSLGGAGLAANLDTTFAAGVYTFDPTATGHPTPGSNYGVLEVVVSEGDWYNGSNNWCLQKARLLSGTTYSRIKVNAGLWSAWDIEGGNPVFKTKGIVGTNFNEYITSGVWQVYGGLDLPNQPPLTAPWAILNVFVGSNGYITQEVTQVTAPFGKWYRGRTETVWGEWQTVLTTAAADIYGSANSIAKRDASGDLRTNQNLWFSDADGFGLDDADNKMYVRMDGQLYEILHKGNDDIIYMEKGLADSNLDLTELNGAYLVGAGGAHTNHPGLEYSLLDVTRNSVGYVVQDAVGIGSFGRRFRRRTETGAWSEWFKYILQQDLTAAMQSPPYAVTTGSSAAYAAVFTPAVAALSAGLRVTIKAHAASAGPITLSVNALEAKAIKKPNGNNPTLTAGGVYSLVYDGTAFILQGEGGEYGTAANAQVLTGYSIGTEYGLVQGTMPNYQGVAKDAVGTILNEVGDLFLNPPAGYYDPTASIHTYEANLANRKNWRSDVTLFGKTGTMPVITSGQDPAQGVGKWPDGGLAVYPSEGYRKGGAGAGEIKVSVAQLQSLGYRRYASGTSEKNAANADIIYTDGTSQSQQLATVTGLGFTPRMISVYYTNTLGEHSNTIYVAATGEIQLVAANSSLTKRAKLSNNPSISINQNGFTIPVSPTSLYGATFNWEAWE